MAPSKTRSQSRAASQSCAASHSRPASQSRASTVEYGGITKPKRAPKSLKSSVATVLRIANDNPDRLWCFVCKAGFTKSDHVKRHIATTHIPLSEQYFEYCPYNGCDRKFGRYDSLQRHVDSIHKEMGKLGPRVGPRPKTPDFVSKNIVTIDDLRFGTFEPLPKEPRGGGRKPRTTKPKKVAGARKISTPEIIDDYNEQGAVIKYDWFEVRDLLHEHMIDVSATLVPSAEDDTLKNLRALTIMIPRLPLPTTIVYADANTDHIIGTVEDALLTAEHTISALHNVAIALGSLFVTDDDRILKLGMNAVTNSLEDIVENFDHHKSNSSTCLQLAQALILTKAYLILSKSLESTKAYLALHSLLKLANECVESLGARAHTNMHNEIRRDGIVTNDNGVLDDTHNRWMTTEMMRRAAFALSIVEQAVRTAGAAKNQPQMPSSDAMFFEHNLGIWLLSARNEYPLPIVSKTKARKAPAKPRHRKQKAEQSIEYAYDPVFDLTNDHQAQNQSAFDGPAAYHDHHQPMLASQRLENNAIQYPHPMGYTGVSTCNTHTAAYATVYHPHAAMTTPFMTAPAMTHTPVVSSQMMPGSHQAVIPQGQYPNGDESSYGYDAPSEQVNHDHFQARYHAPGNTTTEHSNGNADEVNRINDYMNANGYKLNFFNEPT